MRYKQSGVFVFVPIVLVCAVGPSAWAQTLAQSAQPPTADLPELPAELSGQANPPKTSDAAPVYAAPQSTEGTSGAPAPGGLHTAPWAAELFDSAAATIDARSSSPFDTVNTPFVMIGDLTPVVNHALPASGYSPGPPVPPGPRGARPVISSVRTFKFSENQSPRPQDRVFFDFRYYNNLGDSINRHDITPVTQIQAYVYNFGFEKTFNNGKGSIGMRLPLDNLTANSVDNVVNTPTSTALGDLTIFGKYIVKENVLTGSLISACFAITPATGTARFAGAPYVIGITSTYLQPCLAYIYNGNRWYIQGFSGFNVPTNPNDVSVIYNDIGFGYYLYQNYDSPAWLSAVAPTFEVHVNNPVNHRDWTNRSDFAAMPDMVDLTFGWNFGFRNNAVLTAAFVTPVASPKPFDSEAILMLNIYFGRTRAGMVRRTPPPAT